MRSTDQILVRLHNRERCDLYLTIAIMMALITFTAPMMLAFFGWPLSFELSWAMFVGSLKAILSLAVLQAVVNIWLYWP